MAMPRCCDLLSLSHNLCRRWLAAQKNKSIAVEGKIFQLKVSQVVDAVISMMQHFVLHQSAQRRERLISRAAVTSRGRESHYFAYALRFARSNGHCGLQNKLFSPRFRSLRAPPFYTRALTYLRANKYMHRRRLLLATWPSIGKIRKKKKKNNQQI